MEQYLQGTPARAGDLWVPRVSCRRCSAAVLALPVLGGGQRDRCGASSGDGVTFPWVLIPGGGPLGAGKVSGRMATAAELRD